MLVARFHIDVHTCLTRVHVPQRHNDTLRSAEHWISRNTTERLQKHFDKFDVATSRGQMKRLEMASHSQLYSTIFNYIRLYSTIFNSQFMHVYANLWQLVSISVNFHPSPSCKKGMESSEESVHRLALYTCKISNSTGIATSRWIILKCFEISSKHTIVCFASRLVARSPILRSLLNIPQLLFVVQPLKLIAS